MKKTRAFLPIKWMVLSLLPVTSSFVQAQFEVERYSPSSQSFQPSESFEVVVAFNRPVDPALVDALSFRVFGRWGGVVQGAFAMEDNGRQIRFTPSTILSAGEWVTVTLSSSIKSVSGETMAKGLSWSFWTTAGAGNFNFVQKDVIDVRKSGEGHIRTYGAYAGDLDGDGFHDFTVPNEDSHDLRVFMNDGAGNYADFTLYALPDQSFPSTNEGADFNRDGLLDFAVGAIGGNAVSVFLGDGTGAFASNSTWPAGRGVRGLGVVDLNSDGAPDLVTANRASSNISVFLNNGDGNFGESRNFDTGGNGETSCAVADANNDGLQDVFIGCKNSEEMIVLLNDGAGGLSVSEKIACGGDAWMIAVGDLNGDGNVDVVSANAGQNQFSVLFGDGAGRLSAATIYDTGRFPLAIDLGDLDGDNDLDLATSNYASADWTLFENDGDGNFGNPRTLQAGEAGSCAVFHDRDRDGDLDMTGIDELADRIYLFENTGVQTGIHQPPPHDFTVSDVFPNPFSLSSRHAREGILIALIFDSQEVLDGALYNILGEQVQSISARIIGKGAHQMTLPVKQFSPGVYFLQLNVGNRRVYRKILLIR